jgi:hypothetical protein
MMPLPTCPSCKGTQFGTHVINPTGSAFKLTMVYCTSCGAPAGVTEFFNLGARLDDLEKLIRSRPVR